MSKYYAYTKTPRGEWWLVLVDKETGITKMQQSFRTMTGAAFAAREANVKEGLQADYEEPLPEEDALYKIRKVVPNSPEEAFLRGDGYEAMGMVMGRMVLRKKVL